jgi:large subunit ribosomal protein L24
VMLIDPKTRKPTRVGTEIHEGRRFRVARPSGTRID